MINDKPAVMDWELSETDPEDIEDLLAKVEKSFRITFAGNELAHVRTFGELCDHIVSKLQLKQTDDCTSQQAFYKLREAISSALSIKKKDIAPDLLLKDILPRTGRKGKVKNIERYLGFELNILRSPHWVTATLAVILLSSFGVFFFSGVFGAITLASSIVALVIANKTGTVLDERTVGDVAEKMTRENYMRSRHVPGTVNKKEIEDVLRSWFSKELLLDPSKLTREAKLV